MKNTLPQTAQLPLRAGVSASCIQVPAGNWPTALDFLCERFPSVSESVWRSRFARQLIFDVTGKPLAPTMPCRCGERIYYYRELPNETVIPFAETILYQDEQILVADKPHFLPVIPSGQYVQQTLLARLRCTTAIAELVPLHRIDKDTAGLVMFSVNPETRSTYQALFRERKIHKRYLAVAPYKSDVVLPLCYRSRLVEDAQFFRTQEVAGETNSETLIKVLAQKNAMALYDLQPITGKKHQLRVHMASLGIPLINDALYPAAQEKEAKDYTKPLQLLAKSLRFVDPLSGEERYFESRQRLALWPEQTKPTAV